jgi:enoyl-CoA hydratase
MTRVADLVGAASAHLVTQTVGRARVIVINRPDARNALTRQMRRDFPALIQAAESDSQIDAVILTGMDPAFSAGVDLKERAAGAEPLVKPNPAEVLRAARKPIIAAVNGACVTGALEMALSCSFIIASTEARFADTHAKVGLMPKWGQTTLLPDAIGVRRARHMMLTGEFIDARTALDWGLVNEIAPHDTLLDRCVGLVSRITAVHPECAAAVLQELR